MTKLNALSFALITALLSALNGCAQGSDLAGSGDAPACKVNSDCDSGEQCVDTRCEAVSNKNSNLPSGNGTPSAGSGGSVSAAGSGGSPGSSGKGGNPGSSGGGGSPQSNTCDPSEASSQCGKCGASKCCDELSACGNDQACVSLVNCLSDCSTQACYDKCAGQYPGGIPELNAYSQCLDNSCASACDSGSQDPPGAGSCEDILKADTCADCAEDQCCAELSACVGDSGCLACLQGDESKCSGSKYNALGSCLSGSCKSACDSGSGGSGGSGGSSSSDLPEKCSQGAAVLCYCGNVATEQCLQGAYQECLSGSLDGFKVYCGADYYKDQSNPPDCSSYSNGCF